MKNLIFYFFGNDFTFGIVGCNDENWLYQLRGDLGGFGIGSDFTW